VSINAFPEISYIDRVHISYDQRTAGACGLFAIAAWVSVMYPRQVILDSDVLAVYADAHLRAGRTAPGLYTSEAFSAASRAGWLPGRRAIRRVADLSKLANQPILASYRMGAPWRSVSPQGCLDHAAPRPGPTAELHKVLIVGAGHLTDLPGNQWVYHANAWGADWGYGGIGVMGTNLHHELLHSLYILEE
jgi:hypothetical protein